MNATNLGGSDVDLIESLSSKKSSNRRLVSQVQFGTRAGDDGLATTRLQGSDDR